MLPASLLAEWKGLGIDCQSTFEFLFSLSPCLPISPGAAVTTKFPPAGWSLHEELSQPSLWVQQPIALWLFPVFVLSLPPLLCQPHNWLRSLGLPSHHGPHGSSHLDWAQSWCLRDKYSPQPLGVTPKVPDESHSMKSYLVRRDFPTLWLIVSSSLFFLDM